MRSIIIFGGSRGIGKIIAHNLSLKGDAVSVAGRNRYMLDALEQNFTKQKLNIFTVKADITNIMFSGGGAA